MSEGESLSSEYIKNDGDNLINSLNEMIIDILENPEVSERSIYKAPQKIRQINESAYTPRVISIGPYHHEDQRLKSMESIQQFKLIYLKSVLDWSKLTLKFFVRKLRHWQPIIQKYYSEKIQQESDDFVKLILIDACFIIELFLRYYRAADWRESDPLLSKPWLLDDVTQDLILLENQLPFNVLEDLYNLATSRNPYMPSFLQITFNYFDGFNLQNIPYDGVRVWHFTDLLRIFYLSTSEIFQGRSEVGTILERLYSASELDEAGMEFEVNKESKCLLELQYNDKGVLKMPCFDISDRTEIHLRNIIAFEQSHYPSETYITDYLKVLDFLINNERDVDILIHKGIINSLLGNSIEVATMINRMCSNLIQPNMNKKYLAICEKLNAFYDQPINKLKASLIHDYFNTPVKAATSITAIIIIIILTFIQTICSIYPLVKGD